MRSSKMFKPKVYSTPLEVRSYQAESNGADGDLAEPPSIINKAGKPSVGQIKETSEIAQRMQAPKRPKIFEQLAQKCQNIRQPPQANKAHVFEKPAEKMRLQVTNSVRQKSRGSVSKRTTNERKSRKSCSKRLSMVPIEMPKSNKSQAKSMKVAEDMDWPIGTKRLMSISEIFDENVSQSNKEEDSALAKTLQSVVCEQEQDLVDGEQESDPLNESLNKSEEEHSKACDDIIYNPKDRGCTAYNLRPRRYMHPWWINDGSKNNYYFMFTVTTLKMVREQEKIRKLMKKKRITPGQVMSKSKFIITNDEIVSKIKSIAKSRKLKTIKKKINKNM